MGSSCSNTYANAVMLTWETQHVFNGPYRELVLFYRRFVDDLFILWGGTASDLLCFVDYINNTTQFLKFTLNYSEERISFLDVFLEKESSGTISTRLFRKECHVNTLLSRESMHPRYVFRNVAQNEIFRAFRLSARQDEFEKQLIKTGHDLEERGYEKNIIEDGSRKVKQLRGTRAKPYFSDKYCREVTKLEKPDIHVITEGSVSTGLKVRIECSSSSYKLTSCSFYKNEYKLYLPNSSTQYVIEGATVWDEGLYMCDCNTQANMYTETSFRAPLIISEIQVEEPDIQIEEKGNKIICTSRNSYYEYRMCILYQNDEHVQDTGDQYNTRPTQEVSFTVPNLPDETLFKCLCYTSGRMWTRNSSAITKGMKYPDYTVINIIKLSLGLVIVFWMVILVAESRCQNMSNQR
ncbi:uncharacterized protein LOC122815279 [Protopterus annectens]|uniref:uncharacterized protein LOC122815279 n=1 Tax=Protopterus annectens TaxID=7888 RepID=UPI001CFA648B|nr:uncharacterized protein LOC122815279 [Protopterus annectens]